MYLQLEVVRHGIRFACSLLGPIVSRTHSKVVFVYSANFAEVRCLSDFEGSDLQVVPVFLKTVSGMLASSSLVKSRCRQWLAIQRRIDVCCQSLCNVPLILNVGGGSVKGMAPVERRLDQRSRFRASDATYRPPRHFRT